MIVEWPDHHCGDDLVLFSSGRQYDKDGNMRQWWNNETIQAFRERAQCMVDQYSGYQLDPLELNVSNSLPLLGETPIRRFFLM